MRRISCLSVLAALISLSALEGRSEAAPINPGKTTNLPPPPETPKPPPPSFSAPPPEGFSWWAPPRAQLWTSAWRPQTWPEQQWPKVQTYDPAYVNPTSWPIVVQACLTEAEWKLDQAGKATKHLYTWKYEGKEIKGNKCTVTLQFPAQGRYPVSLQVNAAAPKTLDVTVRDILIVAMGDSMSSGEGAPDQYVFEGTPFREAEWVDRQCHRSKSAPAAQAAMQLEKSDPHTSVTFLSFACSGARLEKEWGVSSAAFDGYETTASGVNNGGSGILGPYVGIESPAGERTLDIEDYAAKDRRQGVSSQVFQIQQALRGKRVADAIVMSAGLNDFGFSKILGTCVLTGTCWSTTVGFQPNQVPLSTRIVQDAAPIPNSFKRLGQEIAGLSKRTLVFEYPNPLTGAGGKPCTSMLDDVLVGGPFSVSEAEAKWLLSIAEPLLHSKIREGVAAAGFEFVPGPWKHFAGHGYCAPDNQRWIMNAIDSTAAQGPVLRKNTTGTIHPNFYGYNELSKFIVKALTSAEMNERPIAKADSYETDVSKLLKVPSISGVLANDTDADIFANLRVVNYTQPKSGKVQVDPNGAFEYKAHQPADSDSFLYTVTDGRLEATTRVNIKLTRSAPAAPATPTAPAAVLKLGVPRP